MIAGNGDPPPGKPLLPITSRGSQDPEYDMSFECMAWAVKQKTGKGTRKAVLMALANRTNHDTGLCRPRIKTLAEDVEMSEETVKRAIKELSDLGFIEVIRRFEDGVQLANDYRVLMGVGSHRPQGGITQIPGWDHTDTPCNQEVEPGIEPVAATSSLPAPEASPKHRKQRPQFQEPTLEEWMAFCREKWPWMTPIHAEQSWNHYHLGAVDGQWVQKDGTHIKSWSQCANTSHGLFIASNPDAKARYHRTQQTAARAAEGAQKPAESGWRNSPEWFAHVERCKAEGKSMQETLLSFVPGGKA